MGDLLIRGMEPPQNEPLLVKINPDGSVSTTAKNGYKKYEAVPIPPHGDLIEREWMREAFYRYAKTGGVLYDLADKAPTIIPASEERT